MADKVSRVLKKDEVTVEGQRHLDIAGGRINMQQGRAGIVGEPQARVVESSAEFAVIEVTCGCGRKTHLRCRYADT
jgi:hypothetical protein